MRQPVQQVPANNVVKTVSNYGEVYERNVGTGRPLKLPRGVNALWSAAGLMFAAVRVIAHIMTLISSARAACAQNETAVTPTAAALEVIALRSSRPHRV